jgi:hypothetical protein
MMFAKGMIMLSTTFWYAACEKQQANQKVDRRTARFGHATKTRTGEIERIDQFTSLSHHTNDVLRCTCTKRHILKRDRNQARQVQLDACKL